MCLNLSYFRSTSRVFFLQSKVEDWINNHFFLFFPEALSTQTHHPHHPLLICRFTFVEVFGGKNCSPRLTSMTEIAGFVTRLSISQK